MCRQRTSPSDGEVTVTLAPDPTPTHEGGQARPLRLVPSPLVGEARRGVSDPRQASRRADRMVGARSNRPSPTARPRTAAPSSSTTRRSSAALTSSSGRTASTTSWPAADRPADGCRVATSSPSCDLHDRRRRPALSPGSAAMARGERLGLPEPVPRHPRRQRASLAPGAKVLDVEDRLLFLVVDRRGYPVGHMGLQRTPSTTRWRWRSTTSSAGIRAPEPGLMGLAWSGDARLGRGDVQPPVRPPPRPRR